MDTSSRSPAMALLTYVWQHRSRAVRASNRRSGRAMGAALFTAIEGGLFFAKEDFTWLAANQRPSYSDTSPFGFRSWTELGTYGGEPFYTAACKARHTTACQAFEAWKQRPPFVWEGHRLHSGSQIRWQEEWVTLTSFAEDGTTITLCSYDRGAVETCQACRRVLRTYEHKVLHRYKVTRDDLRQADPTRNAVRAHAGAQ